MSETPKTGFLTTMLFSADILTGDITKRSNCHELNPQCCLKSTYLLTIVRFKQGQSIEVDFRKSLVLRDYDSSVPIGSDDDEYVMLYCRAGRAMADPPSSKHNSGALECEINNTRSVNRQHNITQFICVKVN